MKWKKELITYKAFHLFSFSFSIQYSLNWPMLDILDISRLFIQTIAIKSNFNIYLWKSDTKIYFRPLTRYKIVAASKMFRVT